MPRMKFDQLCLTRRCGALADTSIRNDDGTYTFVCGDHAKKAAKKTSAPKVVKKPAPKKKPKKAKAK